MSREKPITHTSPKARKIKERQRKERKEKPKPKPKRKKKKTPTSTRGLHIIRPLPKRAYIFRQSDTSFKLCREDVAFVEEEDEVDL